MSEKKIAELKDEDRFLIRRIRDLARISEREFRVMYSDFLTPAQQTVVEDHADISGNISFDGGYDEAERRMCRICTDEYQTDEGAPIEVYRLGLTDPSGVTDHRSVLGSLMGLGINREKIGDIIVEGNSAVVLCSKSIASYIEIGLEKIGRYRVRTEKSDIPDIPEPVRERVTINISTPRLDSVCAEGFCLSRVKASEAIRKGMVCVDWRICTDTSRELSGGERISFRGRGKIRFIEVTGTSKKGRMFAAIEKYK